MALTRIQFLVVSVLCLVVPGFEKPLQADDSPPNIVMINLIPLKNAIVDP